MKKASFLLTTGLILALITGCAASSSGSNTPSKEQRASGDTAEAQNQPEDPADSAAGYFPVNCLQYQLHLRKQQRKGYRSSRYRPGGIFRPHPGERRSLLSAEKYGVRQSGDRAVKVPEC